MIRRWLVKVLTGGTVEYDPGFAVYIALRPGVAVSYTKEAHPDIVSVDYEMAGDRQPVGVEVLL